MEIELALQPIVLPMTGRATSYEVLARGISPRDGSVLMPGQMMLEAHGMCWQDIDLTVLAQLQTRHDEIPSTAGISINIAPETILTPGYWNRYCLLLDGLVRAWTGPLIVELSERIDIPEPQLSDVIQPLRELGAWIALDDLGAECASRARLAFHDWDICKIDYRPHTRSGLVDTIEQIVADCRHDGVLTVLEGIESSEDVLMARRLEVDRCQGYAHGRPFLMSDPVVPRPVYATGGACAW